MKKKKLSPRMSFGEWTEYWMESTKEFREMTTDAKYREILDSTLLPRFRDCQLQEITEEMLLEYFLEEKEKGRSISRMKQMLSLMAICLTSAVNHNLIIRNPSLNLQLPMRVRQEAAILTDKEMQRLAERERDHLYMPMILIMLLLGLRVGEAIGLDWEKVDLEGRRVRIDQQSVRYYAEGRTREQVVPHTKNKMIRTLPLCNPAWETLWGLRQKTEVPKGPVFRGKEGGRVKYDSFYYEFNKLMASIGREDVHPHSLRHTAASTLLYETGDLLLVKEFLGHRSIQTSEHYPEATEEEQRAVAEALDRFFLPYMIEVFSLEELEQVGFTGKEIAAAKGQKPIAQEDCMKEESGNAGKQGRTDSAHEGADIWRGNRMQPYYPRESGGDGEGLSGRAGNNL